MTNVYEALQYKGMIPEGEVDFTPRCAFDALFRLGYVAQIRADKALEMAKAMLKGHCNVAEISFSEKNAGKAVGSVKKELPEMVIGATVENEAQCREAIEAGADFVVCQSANTELGELCREAGIPVVLSCSTVDEVRAAHAAGVSVVNYNWEKGTDNITRISELAAMEPVDLKFIVSLGDDTMNIGVCESAQFVLCVRGTWLQNFCMTDSFAEDRIVVTCEELLTQVLGYAMWHIGINTEGPEAARDLGDRIHEMFRLKLRDNGISSRFAGTGIEVMKKMYLGDNGHFAMRTNKADRAILLLKEQGYDMDWETKFPAHGPIATIYMKNVSLGGFAIHLLQRVFPDM